MELRTLRYFLAVVDAGSFRRAAHELHMTQPPLSREVRRLEERLGAQLLDRGSRPVVPTPAGELLAREARAVLARLDRAADGVRRLGGAALPLRVSFLGAVANGVLPVAVRDFRNRHPDVHLVLEEIESGPAGLTLLSQQRIDLVLVRQHEPDPSLRRELILDEPFVAILPDEHALAGAPELDITELGDEDFVFWARSSSPATFDAAVRTLRQVGLDMRIVQEAHGVQTVLGLVAAGLGISLLPASVAHLHRDGVVSVPLRPPRPTIPLYAVWDDERAEAVAPFVAALRVAAA